MESDVTIIGLGRFKSRYLCLMRIMFDSRNYPQFVLFRYIEIYNVISWQPSVGATDWVEMHIFTYINTKMSVCLLVRDFLGHFETDLETIWHKVAFCFWYCSKTIVFLKMLFFLNY